MKKNLEQLPALPTVSGLGMILYIIFICGVIYLLSPPNSFAQTLPAGFASLKLRESKQAGNHGRSLIYNYTPDEYGGHIQNWGIVQDKRGVLYFANGGAVLEYDGNEWRAVHPKFTRSLAISASSKDGDDKETIYVGGFNDFGYLQTDASGNLMYISLTDKIDEKYTEFSDIWYIHVIDDKVYFLANDKLFIYANDHIRVIESETASFHKSFAVNGEYFIRQDKGLTKLTGDSLKLIVNKEEFKGDKIMAMLPFEENKILIGTRNSGLFLLDGNIVNSYETEVSDFLKKNQIYQAIVLSDGRYAFGTLRGGLIVSGKNGNFSRIINKENGLQDNTVLYTLEDRDGGLFLALFNGITKVEISSPFTLYDGQSGLQGTLYSVTKHNNIVYASTAQGVFYLNDNEITGRSGTDWIEHPSKFHPVAGINSQCYTFTPFSKEKASKAYWWVQTKAFMRSLKARAH